MRGLALAERSIRSIGVVAVLASAVSVYAQTQISVPNCTLHGTNYTVSGSCTVTPFGAMTVSASVAAIVGTRTLNITFSFSSASGSFSALAVNQPYTGSGSMATVSGTADVTGGSGAFAGASGTFTYGFVGSGPIDAQVGMLSGTGTINVQSTMTSTSLPDAMLGVPYSANVAQGLSHLPANAQFGTSAGSSPPPGLTLSASGLVSGTPTQPGSFTFNVTFSQGTGTGGTIAVSLNVTGNSGPAITVNPGALSFSLTQGSVAVMTQSIVIANSGGSAQNFTVTATPNSGGNWLTASPSAGTVAPFTNGAVSVNVDPSSLKVGTFLGTVSISISPANQQFDIAVTAAVGSGQAQLQISQSGLRFRTVAAGGAPPQQSIAILNSGSGSLNFSATSSTTSGGSWLSVSPGSGTATSGSSASVVVSVDPQNLKPGDYYGQIQISADGAINSPQTASVVLNVAAAGTDLGAFVAPTGLIFVGQVGGADPAAKTISVTNPSPANLTFSAASFFTQGNNWFTVQPATGVVNATNPAQITVQPTLAKLVAGIYFGEIVLHFGEDRTTRRIAVLLIVTPGAPVRTTPATAAASTCTPSKLLPVFTQLGADFATVAAWPTPIEVTIVDDCGSFLKAGNVTASFSDSDPSLPLTSLQDGRWSATWQPRSSATQVVITVDASEIVPPLQGQQSIGGALQSNPATPSINAGGVVSAAKSASNQPLSPGGFTSIYGLHLSAGQNPALSLPLATQLGATQVVLGGRLLPLQFAADGQVNAVIPYDVPANSTQQLIVTNGAALSVPETVVIATAQPAVFAQGEGSGVVFGVKAGSSAQVLVDASHPVSAGDAIVIYCAGLGPVNPPVEAGAAAPSSPPATTTNPVTVTIGGKSAQVFFGGLVGGFAGLYQVNAYVPKGIVSGNTVPLVVSAASFASAPVTIAIK